MLISSYWNATQSNQTTVTTASSAPVPTTAGYLASGSAPPAGAYVGEVTVILVTTGSYPPPSIVTPFNTIDLYAGSTKMCSTTSDDCVLSGGRLDVWFSSKLVWPNNAETYHTIFQWPSGSPTFTLRLSNGGPINLLPSGNPQNYVVGAAMYVMYSLTPPPPQPTINAPTGNGRTYNPLCYSLLTLPANANPMRLGVIGSIGGGSQALLRSSLDTSGTPATGAGASGRKVVVRNDSGYMDNVSVANTGIYCLVADNASDMDCGDEVEGRIAFTKASTVYDQSTLTANTTKIKAVDINELRTMLNNVCAYYGMAAPIWSGGAVRVNETSLANWTAHVTELRTVIDTIRAYVNNWDSNNTIHDIPAISWIPITVNCPTVAVMNQVRDAITTI